MNTFFIESVHNNIPSGSTVHSSLHNNYMTFGWQSTINIVSLILIEFSLIGSEATDKR